MRNQAFQLQQIILRNVRKSMSFPDKHYSLVAALRWSIGFGKS